MPPTEEALQTALKATFELYDRVLHQHEAKLRSQEIGLVQSIGQGIAKIIGLPHVQSEEIVRFTGGSLGLVFNLDPEEVGVVLLDASDQLQSGTEVRRTGKVLDVPVGDALLGRVIDPLGRPLDGKGDAVTVATQYAVEGGDLGVLKKPLSSSFASLMNAKKLPVLF